MFIKKNECFLYRKEYLSCISSFVKVKMTRAEKVGNLENFK
jgi:hypothetical protein